MAGHEFVSLYDPDTKDDIAKGLVSQGLVLAEQRKEKRFAKLVSEYAKAQEKAKANRVRPCILKLKTNRGGWRERHSIMSMI